MFNWLGLALDIIELAPTVIGVVKKTQASVEAAQDVQAKAAAAAQGLKDLATEIETALSGS